jgi:hypothetical protein
MSFLKSINVKLPRKEHDQKFPRLPIEGDILALLDTMIRRRHHIVHRADKTRTGNLQEITEAEVASWLAATLFFTLSVATENFMKQHSFEEFRKVVNKAAESAG